MRVKVCFRCRLSERCEYKIAKLKSIRGLGLTLISFPCQLKADDLRSGMVCIAKLPMTWDGKEKYYMDDGPRLEEGEIRVVVRRWKGASKVLVAAFPGQQRTMMSRQGQPILNASLYPNLLTPTGETVPVTECCQFPVGEGWETPQNSYCLTCNPI